MTDQHAPPKQSLKERAMELVEGLVGVLEDLFPAPGPTLVPIPVDRRRRPRR